MKTIGFVIKSTTNFVFFLFQDLMEEIKTVVAEKKHFEFRNVSKWIALFVNSYFQDNHARHKKLPFSKRSRL